MKISIPSRTQKNGTLPAYILLAKTNKLQSKSNIKFNVRNGYVVIKDMMLTKYKLNETDKYVNLLDRKKMKSNDKVDDQTKNEKNNEQKILTHLLSRFTIYTMDSEIDFDRFQMPDELVHDIR